MTPGTHCYFDYYQESEENRIEEPITGSKRHTTVEKVYEYEPTPDSLNPKEASFILGAQEMSGQSICLPGKLWNTKYYQE